MKRLTIRLLVFVFCVWVIFLHSTLTHADDPQGSPTGICAGGGRPAGPCTSATDDHSSPSEGARHSHSEDDSNSSSNASEYRPPKPNPKRDSLAYLRYGIAEIRKLSPNGDSKDYEYRNTFRILQHAVAENRKNCAAIYAEADVLYLAGRYTDAVDFLKETKKCGNMKQVREFWNIDNLDEWISEVAHTASNEYPCSSWNCNEEWTNKIWGDARSLFKAKRYQQAEQLYRREIALHPDYPRPYRNLGDCLFFEERYWEAIRAYRSAMELTDNTAFLEDLEKLMPLVTVIAYEKDARNFIAKGDFAPAQDAINKAVKNSGDWVYLGGTVDVHEVQSELYIAEKNWKKARTELEGPLNTDLEYPGGLDNALRKVYDGIYGSPTKITDERANFINGDKALGAKDWRAAQFYFLTYALTPEGAGNPSTYALLAYSFERGGETNDAKFVLELGAELYPNDPQLRVKIAEMRAKSNDHGTPEATAQEKLKQHTKFKAMEDNIKTILQCPQGFDGGNCK